MALDMNDDGATLRARRLRFAPAPSP